jgi:hypothetical protein
MLHSILIMTPGQPIYDGSSFAAYEDVIVVTTNYRTNGGLRTAYVVLTLTAHSIRLSRLTRTATDRTQSWLARSTLRPGLGATQHPRFRRRPVKDHNLW